MFSISFFTSEAMQSKTNIFLDIWISHSRLESKNICTQNFSTCELFQKFSSTNTNLEFWIPNCRTNLNYNQQKIHNHLINGFKRNKKSSLDKLKLRYQIKEAQRCQVKSREREGANIIWKMFATMIGGRRKFGILKALKWLFRHISWIIYLVFFGGKFVVK